MISSKIPQVLVGNIRSRDAFRPIAREQIYLIDHNGRYLPSGVNIRFGMYSRDNTAQKDDFNSFIPATITIFLGANPTRVVWRWITKVIEFEPLNRVLLQCYPLFQYILIPIILIQTCRERHYFMPRKPSSGRYSHTLFSWLAKYHHWPKQTNLQWCFESSPTWGSFWRGPWSWVVFMDCSRDLRKRGLLAGHNQFRFARRICREPCVRFIDCDDKNAARRNALEWRHQSCYHDTRNCL